MGELRATISLLEPLEQLEIPTLTISEDTLSEAEGRRVVGFEVESVVEEVFNITKEIEDLKSNLTGTCPLCDSDLYSLSLKSSHLIILSTEPLFRQ